MDTSSPPNNVSEHTQLQSQLMDQYHELSKKHVNVSYTLIGVIGLLVLVMCLGGWFATKIYEKEVERAMAAEKVANDAQALMQTYKTASDASMAAVQVQIAKNDAQRMADAAKIASLTQAIIDRDKQTATQVNQVLASKPAKDAYADAAAHYPLKSPFVSDKDSAGNERLTLLVPDVQQMTAAKIEGDAAKANLADTTAQVNTLKLDNLTLKSDLNSGTAAFKDLQKTEAQCELTVKDKDDAIKKLNKTLVLTKWAKFKRGALKAVEIGAALVAGYKLGKL